VVNETPARAATSLIVAMEIRKKLPTQIVATFRAKSTGHVTIQTPLNLQQAFIFKMR
jgi:hypothetical protein